jgi:hypothetical protein
MERSDVALGKAAIVEGGDATAANPSSLEDRLAVLEAKMDMVLKMLTANDIHERKEEFDLGEDEFPEINKDGIPIDINLIGSTKGEVYVLTVRTDAYYIGNTAYPSLSAAASAVRGSRVSGWVFWKLPDGRTAKEVFAKD